MTERTIFLAAREQSDAAERGAFLDNACAGNADLRQRIEALLRADAAADDFLRVPVVAAAAAEDATQAPQAGVDDLPTIGVEPPTPAEHTQAEPVSEDEAIAFLGLPQEPGSLGRLDQYDVLEIVGRGGMGLVLKAYDTALKRVVAVKVLAPQLAASGTARRRFAREAQAAAAVRDEHVVSIYAVNDRGAIPYLVMEFISGITLEQRIKQGGALEVKEILRIGMQTAKGLAAAHAQGLIHRDIKPGNILLENGVPRVKITDFGLARAADDASLTQSGVIAGTPMYMSPEQARAEPVDHRTDLFSLGSVLYTLCTGRPAFRAENTVAVLMRVCEDTPRPIPEITPDIPEWLTAIVGKLLAKNRADRFQSAAELAEVLGQCLAHVQQPQVNPLPNIAALPRPRRHRRRFAAALVAGVLMLAGVGSGIAIWALHLDGSWAQREPNAPRLLSLAERLKQPSPFDTRKREDIPRALLALAGGGDPDQAPPELVAVLGGSRFALPNDGLRHWMAQSPDGKLLAVPCGNDIALYDTGTGDLLRVFSGHTSRTYAVAFSPDGRRFVSGCRGGDHTARVWDVRSGAVVATYTGHNDSVLAVGFNPDGTRVISGSGDGALRMWEADTGKELIPFLGHNGEIGRVAFSPDGNQVVTVGERDKRLMVWEAKTGRAVDVKDDHTQMILGLAFDPQGKLLATGSDGELILWNAKTFEKVKTLATPAGWLAFDPDGQTIMAGKHGNRGNAVHTVTRWKLATGERVASLPLRGADHWAMYELSRDGKTLFATRDAADVPYLREYDAVTGRERFAAESHQGMVYSVAVSPDGKLLASGGADGTVKLWDLASWKNGEPLPPVRTLPALPHPVTCVVFSPDGRSLAIASGDDRARVGTLTLWDVARSAKAGTFASVSSHLLRLAFSPDGTTVAAGCDDGGVRIWDVATRQQKAPHFNHTGRVRCVAFSPDGTILASGGEDRLVQLADVATGRRVRPAGTAPAIVNQVAFSPDGKTFAAVFDHPGGAAGVGALVHIWDVAAWKMRAVPAHTGHMHGLDFCPAGPLLATGGWDGTVRLWDPTTPVPRFVSIRTQMSSSPVHLGFTPEGRYLVVGNENGTMSVLKVPQPPTAYVPDARAKLADRAELANRRSPADALKREDIPADLLQQADAAAGGAAPPELVAILPHLTKQIVAVAISRDGKLVASAGDDRTAKIWDLPTGKVLHTLEHATAPLFDVDFVPGRGKDGEAVLMVVTATPTSRSATLWDVQTGAQRFTLTGHTSEVRHVKASPDGRWIASSDQQGTIHVWDPTSGKRLRTLANPHMEWGDLAVSADGRLLAVAATDGAIRLWDPLSGWLMATLTGHAGPVRAVAFLPDGRTLASSGQVDGTIRLWDLAALRQKQVITVNGMLATKLTWRGDGRLLAADDFNGGKVRVWDIAADPPPVRAFSLFQQNIHGLAMSPDGRYLATANPGGVVYILRLAERGVVYQVQPAGKERD